MKTIRAVELNCNEDMEVLFHEVPDVSKHQCLDDLVYGDYGGIRGTLVAFEPLEPEEALKQWEAGVLKSTFNGSADPVELAEGITLYKAATAGATGCALYWSSTAGTDQNVTFFFDATFQDIANLIP